MYQERGSGWVVVSVDNLTVHLCPYQPIKAACYKPLPAELVKKRAILNIKNKDNRCFEWSILAQLHPVHYKDNANDVRKYEQYTGELDFTGLTFPVAIDQISIFEARNNVSINCYGFNDEKKLVEVLHVTSAPKDVHVNLMLYRGHYSLIRNLDRLLSSQNRHRGRSFFCDRCLRGQFSAETLDDHLKICRVEGAKRIEMPSPDESVLKFKNQRRQLKAPMVVYADFEAILEKGTGLRSGSRRIFNDKAKSSQDMWLWLLPC